MKYHFFSLEYAGELRIFYKEGKIVSVKHASPNSQMLKERPGTTLHPKGYSSQKTDDVSFMSLCCMQLLSMKESARIKQEEVRQIVLETTASRELVLKLELVDTLQRIGVDYHYRKEIDELLRDVHLDAQHEEGCDDDLYVVSLRFYLLRKHGYNVSSGKAW